MLWSDGTHHVIGFRACLTRWDGSVLTHWCENRRVLDERWRAWRGIPPGAVDGRGAWALEQAGDGRRLQGAFVGEREGRVLLQAYGLGRADEPVVLPGQLVAIGEGRGGFWTREGDAWFHWLRGEEGYEKRAPRVDVTEVAPAGEGWLIRCGRLVEWRTRDPSRVEAWFREPTEADYEGWVGSNGLRMTLDPWTGRPGPFAVTGTVEQLGDDRSGLYIDVPESVASGTLDGESATVEGGRLAFPFATLRCRRAVVLELRGAVASSGSIAIQAIGKVFEKLSIQHPQEKLAVEESVLASARAQLTVESPGLTLVRGGERLAFDAAWLADLRPVLDREARPPDLDRWVRRALSRCRVQQVEDDPEGVLAEWLRMTERDRAASGGQLPLYKLSTGRHWVVTDDEARQIRTALPAEHALAHFASAGFEVVGPDPSTALTPPR